MKGPFARVAGAGDCLNVRAAPDQNADVLACMAGGVLLRDLGEMRAAGVATWTRVATPAGAEGWANAAYLEQ